MRSGWNADLEKRLRRPDPAARLLAEAVSVEAEDVKNRPDEWYAADQGNGLTGDAGDITGFSVSRDGRLKLEGSDAVLIENTVHNAGDEAERLHKILPIDVVTLEWSGALARHLEIHRIDALLDPAFSSGGDYITKFHCQVYRAVEVQRTKFNTGADVTALMIAPISEVVSINAITTGGFVLHTFDFSLSAPVRPLEFGPQIYYERYASAQDAVFDWSRAVTFLWIWGTNFEGGIRGAGFSQPALALGAADSVTTNGTRMQLGEFNTIESFKDASIELDDLPVDGKRRIQRPVPADASNFYRISQPTQAGVPCVSVYTKTYTQQAVSYTTGNELDLGLTPSDSVELVASPVLPEGTDLIAEVQNDLGAWVEFKDRDLVGVDNTPQGGKDLSGVSVRQNYEIRATLVPTTNVTPTLVELGARAVRIVDLDGAVKVASVGWGLDALTLKGEIAEANIKIMKDGNYDYRDVATELFSQNYVKDVELRLLMGHPDLARSKWLLLDSFIVDDYDCEPGCLGLTCVSQLARLRVSVPAYDVGTSRQTPKNFDGTIAEVYEDLLANDIGLEERYRGSAPSDSTAIRKYVRSADGKDELDRIAFLAGGTVISSQGRAAYRDIHQISGGRGIAAIFPREEIIMGTVTPGLRARTPEFFVSFGYDEVKEKFAGQVRGFHAPSLERIGGLTLDAPGDLDEETCKWIPEDSLGSGTSALATLVTNRTVQTMGAGLMLWTFTANYAHPELEPGDLVALATDRFVVKDPTAERELKGMAWAVATVVDVHDAWGRSFTVWVRSFADLLPANTEIENLQFVYPQVVNATPTVGPAGNVSAWIFLNLASESCRVYVSLTELSLAAAAAFVDASTRVYNGRVVEVGGTADPAGPLGNVQAAGTLWVYIRAYEGPDGSLVGAKSEVASFKAEQGNPTGVEVAIELTAVAGIITLAITPGVGVYWLRAWLKKGSAPVSNGHPDDDFLFMDNDINELSRSRSIGDGTWHAAARGYDAAGEPGELESTSLVVSGGAGGLPPSGTGNISNVSVELVDTPSDAHRLSWDYDDNGATGELVAVYVSVDDAAEVQVGSTVAATALSVDALFAPCVKGSAGCTYKLFRYRVELQESGSTPIMSRNAQRSDWGELV